MSVVIPSQPTSEIHTIVPPDATELELGLPEDETVPTLPPGNLHGSNTMDVPSGYVSDAELLAWFASKSSEGNDKLRGLMDLSRERSQAIKDLSLLKSAITDAVADPRGALEQLEAIEAAYAGTPLADDILKITGPLKATLVHYKTTLDQSAIIVEHAPEAMNDAVIEQRTAVNETARAALAAQIANASSDIDAITASLSDQDQLALIEIQELMSGLRQASQLASNIMAGNAQAADGIVSNIRA